METPTTASPATSPEVPVIGTTARLFPDMVEAPKEEPAAPPAKPAEPTPPKKEEPKAEAPVTPEPDHLDIEPLGAKKVKVKIDGKEELVSLADVVRGYQTDRHLTQKGQKLAEERKRLEEERKPTPKAEPAKVPAQPAVDPELQKVLDPFLRERDEKIDRLEKVIEEMRPAVVPLQMQNFLDGEEAYWANLGLPGFKEAHTKGVLAKLALELRPEDPSSFDNLQGARELFAIHSARKARAGQGTVETPAAPATPKEPKPTPAIPSVEPGAGGPSGAEDKNAAVRDAYNRAKKSGDRNDWADYFRLRG
jgi:hypothetical protein